MKMKLLQNEIRQKTEMEKIQSTLRMLTTRQNEALDEMTFLKVKNLFKNRLSEKANVIMPSLLYDKFACTYVYIMVAIWSLFKWFA